jgi:VanZ family protein
LKRAVLAFLPAVLYAGLIFSLSAQSNPLGFLPPEFLLQDKLLHGLEYAALGALLVLGLRLTGSTPRTAFVLAVVLASLYGASDEFHQRFVPGRMADVADWVADTLGAALGAAVATGAIVALRRPRGAG